MGLAPDRRYVDGNKRIAFVAMYTFLGIDRQEIVASEPVVVQVMRDVAAGTCNEDELARWLRAHLAPQTD